MVGNVSEIEIGWVEKLVGNLELRGRLGFLWRFLKLSRAVHCCSAFTGARVKREF
jgi:hypothetical protein